MRRRIAIASILIILATLVIQANAEKIQISVNDAGGNPVANALISIMDMDARYITQTGQTDGMGIFEAYMEPGIQYIVKAKKNNRTNEWTGFPTIEIKIII